MTAGAIAGSPSAEPAQLRWVQLAWLAAAVVVISAGFGALMPLLPGWLTPLMPGENAIRVARHVGFLSGIYTAGVLVGAPLWGFISDRVGFGRILIVGLVGYAASLLLVLVPGLNGLWGIYSLLLIGLGIYRNKKHLRVGAIALFALTLVKLFFYDIADLDTISKTVIFVTLGILLLIISFLYNKYKDLIFEKSAEQE